MADRIQISHIVAQVEYEYSPKIKLSHIVGQVEYEYTPKQKISHIVAQVEYLPLSLISAEVASDVGLTDLIEYITGTTKFVYVSDDVGLTDAIYQVLYTTYYRELSDDLGLSDEIISEVISAASQSVNVFDRLDITKFTSFVAYIADEVSTSDELFARIDFARFISSLCDISDSYIRIHDVISLLYDSVSIQDAIFRAATLVRNSTDSIDVTDYVNSGLVSGEAFERFLSEDIGVLDALEIATYYTFLRGISDALGISDQSEQMKYLLLLLSDTTSVPDSTYKEHQHGRLPSDSVGVSDSSQRTVSHIRRVLYEYWVQDYRAKQSSIFKEVSDQVSVIDYMSGFITLVIARDISESLGVSDEVAQLLVPMTYRAITESLGVTDDPRAILSRFLEYVLSESVSVPDSEWFQFMPNLIGRTATSPVGITDARAFVRSFGRIISRSVGVTDRRDMARSITDIVSDILGVADAGGWLRSLGHIRYPTSTAGVTEQFTSVSTSNLLNFMANSVSDKQPSFPLRMFENLKVLQTGYEDGTERVTQGVCYHAREWDVSFNVVNRDDTESFRRFFDSLKGSDKSFFWMEPYLTTRQDVKVGHGNGRQNSWVIPIIGCSSITIMVSNSATAIGYTIYSGPPFSGQHNLPVVLFDTAPQPNQTVTMSYVDGYYVPIVRVKEVFSPELRVPDYSWFQITLKETKEDYPNA